MKSNNCKKRKRTISELSEKQLTYFVNYSKNRSLYWWIDHYNLFFGSAWHFIKKNKIKVKGDED